MLISMYFTHFRKKQNVHFRLAQRVTVWPWKCIAPLFIYALMARLISVTVLKRSGIEKEVSVDSMVLTAKSVKESVVIKATTPDLDKMI